MENQNQHHNHHHHNHDHYHHYQYHNHHHGPMTLAETPRWHLAGTIRCAVLLPQPLSGPPAAWESGCLQCPHPSP